MLNKQVQSMLWSADRVQCVVGRSRAGFSFIKQPEGRRPPLPNLNHTLPMPHHTLKGKACIGAGAAKAETRGFGAAEKSGGGERRLVAEVLRQWCTYLTQHCIHLCTGPYHCHNTWSSAHLCSGVLVRACAANVEWRGLSATERRNSGRRRLAVRVLRPAVHCPRDCHTPRVAQHHHQPRAQQLRARSPVFRREGAGCKLCEGWKACRESDQEGMSNWSGRGACRGGACLDAVDDAA